ncbi:hypothetical protein, conserved [Plasmodium gonderi]|uniref:Uncharacterized protein n=1 Tax=Plasmodium gonderi TaxID=77519 RepID=A0A1Y1JKJ7_PLAGO|nr:hypothetical protein, conserved [Plasmodium gonderi]GAW82168.1 hypothetical protein, conserved [Plasmodium gonderi]
MVANPYHKIVKQELSEDPELKRILAHNIYDNIKNNIDYLEETQYNQLDWENCQKDTSDTALEVELERNNCAVKLGHKEKGECECLENKEIEARNIEFVNAVDRETPLNHKTFNILKNKKNSLQIHQIIPPLNSDNIPEFDHHNNRTKKSEKFPKEQDKMNNHRYGYYPPRNGYGYNHHNISNANGYYTNTYNRELPNLTMQQHNMHGRNNLMFEDGNVPYGLYGQSNYTGTNNLMFGGNAFSNDRKTMYRRNEEMNNEPFYNNYPMASEMGYNMPILPAQQYYPNMKRNLMKEGYVHGHHYANSTNNTGISPKPSSEDVIDKSRKKESCRKNISKVRKGDIDINIETSSSNRKGVIIDLNIGVGN